MASFFELFEYNFFTFSFIAVILASISCGIIGTYIVTRRMVFISGGITHASFGGIGIGYFLGINPILGAIILGVFAAIVIEFLSGKRKMRFDANIGLLWSLGMAVGILFIFITPGYAPNLISYLFGSIIAVAKLDLILLAGLVAVIIIIFSLMYRAILFISFDQEFARVNNINVAFVNYLLIILVALTVVLNIKVAGIILVISFLTIPQSTANFLTSNFKKMMIYSVLISFIGALAGLLLSFQLNIPSGATIVITLSLILFITKLGKYFFQETSMNKR